MTAMPPMTIAMTATILMMANQNSNSPNLLTPMRFIAVMITRNTAADTHAGIAGNQYCTNEPTTASSTIETRM